MPFVDPNNRGENRPRREELDRIIACAAQQVIDDIMLRNVTAETLFPEFPPPVDDSGAREAQPTPEDWGQSNVLEVEEDQKRKLPAASTKRKGNE